MAARLERDPSSLSPVRTVALALGFACALAATVTIFLTDNAQYLRIAIVVALWGFVFAALAAGRRQTEQVVAAGAEVELRKNYEAELGREVAARREYELRLEVQLRRELQDNFAAQVGDLREEMTRLRHELSEQWDSELRVERMVMRTQSVRMGGDRRDAIEQGSGGSYVSDSSGHGESNGHVDRNSQDDVLPSADDAASTREFPLISEDARDAVASTREFPAVTLAPPSHPTAPVPPLLAPASIPSPPVTRAPAPPTLPPTQHESDDVLARVLAEAGSATGGRRRRHRYADEDEP